MKLRFRRHKASIGTAQLRQAVERTAIARREREISEQRLDEVRPLRDVLIEMRKRNHLGAYLDEIVDRREARRREDDAT